MTDERNSYDILGVDMSASQDEIKSAYRKLSRKYHPDLNQSDPHAKKKFQDITDAYSKVRDSEKRAEYDKELKGINGHKRVFVHGMSMEDIEEELRPMIERERRRQEAEARRGYTREGSFWDGILERMNSIFGGGNKQATYVKKVPKQQEEKRGLEKLVEVQGVRFLIEKNGRDVSLPDEFYVDLHEAILGTVLPIPTLKAGNNGTPYVPGRVLRVPIATDDLLKEYVIEKAGLRGGRLSFCVLPRIPAEGDFLDEVLKMYDDPPKELREQLREAFQALEKYKK